MIKEESMNRQKISSYQWLAESVTFSCLADILDLIKKHDDYMGGFDLDKIDELAKVVHILAFSTRELRDIILKGGE